MFEEECDDGAGLDCVDLPLESSQSQSSSSQPSVEEGTEPNGPVPSKLTGPHMEVSNWEADSFLSRLGPLLHGICHIRGL